MGATSRPVPDSHYERFENADAARRVHDRAVEQENQRKRENLELYGTAKELFLQRYLDSFTVERHGVEIEFYRPVDAAELDIDGFREDGNEDLADRLERGGKLLRKYEQQQTAVLTSVGTDDVDLTELYEDALEGTEFLREILSAFAVDESFRDPRIWDAVFPNDEHISEVFEDFFAEGDAAGMRQRLNELQTLISAEHSPDSDGSTE